MSVTKRKALNGLELVEWMLAIDFDAVEVKSSRFPECQKRVVVLDLNALRLDNGD